MATFKLASIVASFIAFAPVFISSSVHTHLHSHLSRHQPLIASHSPFACCTWTRQ